jgi:sulfur relay (sulfurtransferase) complex TusBCD TusD component (DsrE family)
MKAPLLSLDELRALGVTVVVCKPAKARGVTKQKCRAKGAGSYVTGGSRPAGVSQTQYA